MPRAVLVDDEIGSLEAMAELIERDGFSVVRATSLSEARGHLEQGPTPDVVITDLVLPDGSGIDLIEAAGSAPVVLMTGHASVETAIDALRAGAIDYLTKPVDLARLKAILANVGRTRELQEEIGSLRSELRKLGRFGPLVGASDIMANVYDLIAKVAPTDATVCIVGESGTGKEVVAHAVHQLSRRRKQPFVPVNCGAVSPNLIESTLFGHEKGSFTGAERMHRGVFEQAGGGTLFLDEITEMPAELQVKLLRVLETATVTRIGGEQPIPVDVRVIAATNRSPEQAVRDGRLRLDLWYRLNVFPIALPPLRDRPGDVDLIAEHLLAELNAANGTRKHWSTAAKAALERYRWPGNVRELKNVVHRVYILAGDEIGVDVLPREIVGTGPRPSPRPGEAPEAGTISVRVGSSVAEMEQRLIYATLEHCAGNKQKAAELLGVSLKTLYNRLNAYRRDPTGSPSSPSPMP